MNGKDIYICFYAPFVASTLISYLLKVDMEEKVAILHVPAIGVVSELELGALNVMGKHNYYNAAVAALSVLGLDMGIDTETISSTIEKLRAPPHRMQISKLNGWSSYLSYYTIYQLCV